MSCRSVGPLAFVLSFALAGCQNYDFEPVEPLAIAQATTVASVAGRRNTPNLMLLVDKSGSMNAPTDTNNPSCNPGCGVDDLCGTGCPTRWTELQSAMTEFLTTNATLARMGMMTFPADRKCTAPTQPRVELVNSDDASALQSGAAEIREILSNIEMGIGATLGDDLHTGGGTPTGNSLAALQTYGALADPERKNYVLLLTDGLPNCNANNPNDGSTQACFCQAGTASGCQTEELKRLGCLDAAGTVAKISELQSLNIRTIVVGFGLDANENKARETLQAMAQAGGFQRQCPNGTDAECGTGNTCDVASSECTNAYFAARNGAELAEALARIAGTLPPGICEYSLDVVPQNDSSEFIAVRIAGETVPEGAQTWAYVKAKGEVEILGELCDRLKAAPTSQPVDLEIRVIQSL